MINLQYPLLRGLTAAWRVLPGRNYGNKWHELVKRTPDTLSGTKLVGRSPRLDALSFNSGSTTDKVTISQPTTTSTFTVSMWLRPMATGAGAYCMLFGLNSGASGLCYNGTTGKLNVYTGSDNFNTTALTLGKWNHVVWSCTAGSGTFYLNGKADGSFSFGTMSPDVIGNDSLNEYFSGHLDGIMYWAGRAFSANQALALYKEELADCPNILFWPKAQTVKIPTTGNWSNPSTWISGVVPTASTDVVLATALNVDNLVIDSAAACRSLNCTGYTGTLSGSASLSIGDATAGAGNVALILASGMTFTYSGTITFLSTSATQQTIAWGGKTVGNFTFNGAGSDYAITSAITQGSSGIITHSTGTVHYDGVSDNSGLTHNIGIIVSNSGTRSLIYGNATFNQLGVATYSITSATGLTFSGANSTWNIAWAAGSGSTVMSLVHEAAHGTVNLTGSGECRLAGSLTCVNLNRSPSSSNTFNGLAVTQGSSIVVSGTLTLAGFNNTLGRLLVKSVTGLGSVAIITCNGTVAASNVDFRDITGAGSASWNLAAITGLSGDCGGNSGITFTPEATQTWVNTSGGNWDTAANWTSRVPLPQDNVSMACVFTTARIVTTNGMPRLGKSIDWSGASFTTSLRWTLSAACTMYGSLNLTKITIWSQTGTFTLEGRGTHTITSAGISVASLNIGGPGSTYTQLDALTGSSDFNILAGTYNANGFNFTCRTPSSSSTITRNVIMGSGTWTATMSTAGSAWNMSGSGLTITPGTSTIALTDTGSNNKTLTFAGKTYNNITITGTGSGKYTFNDSAAFNVITVTDSKTLNFVPNITITFASLVTPNTINKVVTFDTSTGAGVFKLSCQTGLINCDYLSLTRCVALHAENSKWYAGTHSTNGGSNDGWTFTAPPTPKSVSTFFSLGL